VGPGSTQRPGGFRRPPRPRIAPASGFDLFDIELSPTVARLGQWSALTLGGLGLLLLLSARRRGDRREDYAVARSAGFPAPPSAPAPGTDDTASLAPPPGGIPPPRDEENMPRWLRPSVRAGRQGRRLVD